MRALRRRGTATFRALVADAGPRVVVVARFLALLELARRQAVVFEQLAALGELTIRWTGTAEGDLAIPDEFDSTGDQGPPDEAPAEDAPAPQENPQETP